MTGYVARKEEDRSIIKILTDNSTGNVPLGGPSLEWNDNIIIDLKEIGVNTRRV